MTTPDKFRVLVIRLTNPNCACGMPPNAPVPFFELAGLIISAVGLIFAILTYYHNF